MIEVKKLQKQFENTHHKALDKVSFTISERQFVSVLGESGAGKTTLLKIIAGLEQPDSGVVLFRKEKVKGPYEQLIPGHAHIELVHQDFELAHRTKVALNVRQKLRVRNIPDKQADKMVTETLKYCGIYHLKDKKVEELSGGEKQRLAIARALVTQPSLILLDEPFSHLDHPNKEYFKELLIEIKQQTQLSVLMVTHNAQDALELSDKIITMRKGRLIESGTPEQLYYSPKYLYTAGLMGDYNVIEEEGRTIIVRPEMIKISFKEITSAKKLVVQNVRFQGASYLITALDDSNKEWRLIHSSSLIKDSIIWISVKVV